MDRNMKKWHSYKLSDVVRFNPSERLLKGEIAKKVPMDLLQPYTRGISGFEMASYTGGSKFRNGDTLMARITPRLVLFDCVVLISRPIDAIQYLR